jgi:hypothetical protein
MSLYKELSKLNPYIQSIRKLNDYFSFDIQFPEDWKLPKKFVDEDKVLEQEVSVVGYRLISFVSEINETSMEKCSNNILNIIKFNLEREEKNKLFESKINELKSMFEKQSLEELKNLKFEVNTKTKKVILEENEQGKITKVA